jgi:hypothetical protein
MLKINIKKNNQVQVKSFFQKKELENYLFELTVANIPCVTEGNPANNIWNLNVGSSYKFLGYIISIIGKSPYHNTDHGKQMYGS